MRVALPKYLTMNYIEGLGTVKAVKARGNCEDTEIVPCGFEQGNFGVNPTYMGLLLCLSNVCQKV